MLCLSPETKAKSRHQRFKNESFCSECQCLLNVLECCIMFSGVKLSMESLVLLLNITQHCYGVLKRVKLLLGP